MKYLTTLEWAVLLGRTFSGYATAEFESRPGGRVLLQLLVEPHHGSTALQTLLMSSSQVSTLCSAGSWQCEGEKIRYYPQSHKPNCKASLEFLAPIWNLSKRVFMNKLFAPLKMRIVGRYDQCLRSYFEDGSMPTEMRQAGVTEVRPVYVVMWRHLCLYRLSTNPKSVSEEVRLLEDQVRAIWDLKSANSPVFVISLASFLWDNDRIVRLLEASIPFVAPLNSSFIPVLGQDITEKNSFKISVTPSEFASDRIPRLQGQGFNLELLQCDILPRMHSELRERHDLAMAYLLEQTL